MTDIHQTYNQAKHTQYQLNVSPRVHQAVKAATAVSAGGSRLILLGLILVWTVIALTIATPVLVIFSPVLVPAAITMFLLEAAFSTSGGFRMAAVAVLSWIYRHATGGGSLDEARDKLGYKEKELKEGGAEHHQSGGVGVHASADM